MKKEDKIAKKRKERAKKSRSKVLKIRGVVRKDRKEESRKQRLEKMLSPKQKPIVNEKKEDEETKNQRIREQLVKNQQILAAIEEEMNRERSLRQHVNESLESDGHETMKEKFSAMHKSAVESQEKFKDGDQQAMIGNDQK
jgi:hypothetical protein